VEDLLRPLAPQVLGAIVRRYGHFDIAEDAVQEALLAAATQWPRDGTPDNPRSWLIAVAARRLTDLLRSEQARQRREDTVSRWTLTERHGAPAIDDADDTLVLMFLCCHPALSAASQIALTLRAVGGLSTVEIARAFLVPESTMTRRISRAKLTIKNSGIPFRLPNSTERAERLRIVRHVLYLIFTEGYASTAGPRLHRVELATEAIRLARMLRRLLPADPETAGLLALMLLTNARRAARTTEAGELVPMEQQDRARWNTAEIDEGVALISAPAGSYQLQAAIAAVHDQAPTYAATDWPRIVELYEALRAMADNPVVELNYAVAVGMANGPAVGLTALDGLGDRLADDHRWHAVRAHLLEMAGDAAAARTEYLAAAELTASLPKQRYLHARAARLY
jgi:RNA polymerase sigma factor (sigma-70 family)